MKNIILTGMPAAGKSTVGVLLAKTLGFAFVDTDLIIQQETGRLLQDIISRDGLEMFCAAEERALLSVTAARNTVVATGGSAVCSEKGMLHLKERGLCCYLEVPLEELSGRLVNIKTRGIAMRPGETIGDVFARRSELYNKYADFTVECHGKTAEDIIVEIHRCLAGEE